MLPRAVAALTVVCASPVASAQSLAPWVHRDATLRQAVSVSCRVARQDPVVVFTPGAEAVSGSVRVFETCVPQKVLPVHYGSHGQLAVRLSGALSPDHPRILLCEWLEQSAQNASPVLAAAPTSGDDYATAVHGDAWDFEEGDQEEITSWGDGPTHYGELRVRGGWLEIPITGNDPYWIWGTMFGSAAHRPVERIDSGCYTVLRMRVRQSCERARWSVFATDSSGTYRGQDFLVQGADPQEIVLDLTRLFPGFWDGRQMRALRLDPTNDAGGTVVGIDWVRLERPTVEPALGPLMTPQNVAARALVQRLDGGLPDTLLAGEKVEVRVRALGATGVPIPGACLAYAWASGPSAKPVASAVTDARGMALFQLSAGGAALTRHWELGVSDDLGDLAPPQDSNTVEVRPGPLVRYELSAARHQVPVSQPRVGLTIWGADAFGNHIPVDIDAPLWELTDGAQVTGGPLRGAPATATITCSTRPRARHRIVLHDARGHRGSTELVTMAYKEGPVTATSDGWLVDGDGQLFVPLGGFYANWPAARPDSEGFVRRALDLFPCGPQPYPHGFPWRPEVESQVISFLDLCREQGVTALRLMLRNMDLVGQVDPVQRQALLHLLDLGAARGLRFNVVLFEDYTKPPYVDRQILETVVLPHYDAEQLADLPPHRQRFLVEKRLVAEAAEKYTDPDVLACQKAYAADLLPYLSDREELFCYELENEMVRPPMSWVNEMTRWLHSIDPHTLVLGNPGPHAWPEPWGWRESQVDLLSYHPYNDGSPEADYGAVICARSKWAASAGKPMFTGEGGINQSRWQPGVEPVAAADARRGIRDQIWLSVCCGACGAFMWTPGHEAELEEFGKVRPALAAVGVDLLHLTRRVPRTALVMPPNSSANEPACHWTRLLLEAGVDFDTVPEAKADAYEVRLDASTTPAWRQVPASELLTPAGGWQAAYLLDQEGRQALVYLRNAAGGIVDRGVGRPCYLREPALAAAVFRLVDPERWPTIEAFDLDTGAPASVLRRDDDTITIGDRSSHDFVVGLHR